VDSRKVNSLVSLLLTGFFATVFGISGLTLSAKKVRPTTMAFANTIYKLATTMIGSFIYPTNVPLLSWCGYGLSFLGFLTYTLGRIRFVSRDVDHQKNANPESELQEKVSAGSHNKDILKKEK